MNTSLVESNWAGTLFDPNRHCDAQRVIAWIDDHERKPANMAFTKGMERQIAYRFEDRKSSGYSLENCPKCGGPADNGHDRCLPPNPYYCTKCSREGYHDDGCLNDPSIPSEICDNNTIIEYIDGALQEFDGCVINPSNYDHELACHLNNGYVGLFQTLEEVKRMLSIRKPVSLKECVIACVNAYLSSDYISDHIAATKAVLDAAGVKYHVE
jgi:hypothetical protein